MLRRQANRVGKIGCVSGGRIQKADDWVEDPLGREGMSVIAGRELGAEVARGLVQAQEGGVHRRGPVSRSYATGFTGSMETSTWTMAWKGLCR